MKVYHLPRTRAARVIWTAGELDEPIETQIVNIAEGEQMQPWFLELNPHHKLPVADINGTKHSPPFSHDLLETNHFSVGISV